ncbi:hypothetical protein ACW9HQ_49285, partial [Nocardia gipuzkoensis]
GGFVLLGLWVAKGGVREGGSTRLPAPVVFGHFLLAAAGLVIWIIYPVVDSTALAWIAFAPLVPVALLGFAIVGGHGVFAVATVVLGFSDRARRERPARDSRQKSNGPDL